MINDIIATNEGGLLFDCIIYKRVVIPSSISISDHTRATLYTPARLYTHSIYYLGDQLYAENIGLNLLWYNNLLTLLNYTIMMLSMS